MKTDKGYFVFIVSGNRDKLDLKKIAILLDCSKVKLASPKEVPKVTGFEVGSIPMIGLDLPCVLDKQLFKYDFVYGGTEKTTCTLKIEPHALQELNHVVAILES
ncbi:YbaK/EbsC family protein [Niallia circulans]